MKLWQTPDPLGLESITLVLVLPKGSRDDTYPHEHHIMEHLIFDMIMPCGSKIREYIDDRGIQSNGATSRDLISISFEAPATEKNASDLVSIISCIFSSEWDEKSEDEVVAVLENEMFAISSNMVTSARLSAECAYWGEIDNLDPFRVRTTMHKVSKNLLCNLRNLLQNSLLMIDDPTQLLYSAISKIDTSKLNCIYEVESFESTFSCRESTKTVLARPTNLSSIVLGIDRRLDTLERLSALTLSFCLTRGLRKGILWRELNSRDISLYHMMAWFQSTQKDAVFAIDWISLPEKEQLIKHVILEEINFLVQDKSLLEIEISNSMNEIYALTQKLNGLSVAERLKATAGEILSGSNNPGYLGLVNNIKYITSETCQCITADLAKNPILFINQKAQAEFQD